jgi:hypothetical protein
VQHAQGIFEAGHVHRVAEVGFATAEKLLGFDGCADAAVFEDGGDQLW